MDKEGRTKDALMKVAADLYLNLHSSESENILSSLLTASLNESPPLKEWFCNEVFQEGGGFRHSFAMANHYIPYLCYLSRIKRSYRPDIVIWDRECDDHVDLLLAGDATKIQKRDAAKQLVAIFIEVKHTDLSGSDKRKYLEFIQAISEKCNRIKVYYRQNVRFVVVSSHNSTSDARIDETWRELHTDAGSKTFRHIVFDDVHKELERHSRRYKECHILQVLKHYLDLYLGKWSTWEKYRFYWKQSVEYWDVTKNYSGLKQEVVEFLQDMARRNGIKVSRSWTQYRKDKRDGMQRLERIELVKDNNRYKMVPVAYATNANTPIMERTMSLRVRIAGRRGRCPVFNFDFSELNRTIDDISRTMSKASRLMDLCAAK